MTPGPGFAMVPLGPYTDEDGRWCCGLFCGRPCPYGLKFRPPGGGEPAGRHYGQEDET